MGKYKLPNPQGTSIDPFAFENSFGKPDLTSDTPFSNISDQLEFVADEKIDEGYGTLGNAAYSQKILDDTKAESQGSLELLAKGVGNVARTIGIEIAKVPGYFGGAIGAVGNEILGDGKNSMSYIVDNAWVNSLENLDQDIRDMMPINLTKDVQEGNLLDKLGSGAWWASTGADGLGFMLAMFAPGSVAKALNIGTKIAGVGETLANISTKLGKTATGESWVAKLGLMEATEAGFKYSKEFARNTNGYASAVLNTTLESSAEAANTFDNLKKKYIESGLTEEEANQKAGEGAAAVFKGNMALLFVSNLLDEKFIWKSIGSSGENEAAKNIIDQLFPNGSVDLKQLEKLQSNFSRKEILKKGLSNYTKSFAKEGFYEEGSQTLLQQNIEEGKKGEGVLDDLYNVVTSYLGKLGDNTELQESIFLGGFLGGGASVISTVQENNALKSALYGSEARTKENNIFVKYGLFPETKAQKGFANILMDKHVKSFRSFKDVVDQKEDGSFELNERKLVEAQLENADQIKTQILYDLSLAQGDNVGKEVFGQFLAANYVQPFLGQEGSKELFEDHVKNNVVPAWAKRFEETFAREATQKEIQDYQNRFLESGNKVLDAYKTAENTNYPERYFREDSKDYADFKNEYFHDKFQNIVTLDALRTRKNQIDRELLQSGLTREDLENTSKIKDPILQEAAISLRDELKVIEQSEDTVSEYQKKFYSKSGVEEMFRNFKKRKDFFEELQKEVGEDNASLREEVNKIPLKNKEIIDNLTREAEQAGYSDMEYIPVVDKSGQMYDLNNIPWNQNLENLGLKLSDDISTEQFLKSDTPNTTVSEHIADKIANRRQLTPREESYYKKHQEKVDEIIKTSNQVVKSSEPLDKKVDVDDSSYEELDLEISSEKKGTHLYPTTGRNLMSELEDIGDNIFAEKLNPKVSQRLWFEVLDSEVSKSPGDYSVRVITKSDKEDEDLWKQIDRDKGSSSYDDDKYVVLYKNGKPVIKEGNFVFTSLWRPENLYPSQNGVPKKFILAEEALVEKYVAEFPAEVSSPDVAVKAFFYFKEDYTKWYNSLNSQDELSILGVTNGHKTRIFTKVNGKLETSWVKPIGNIKGLNLNKSNKPSPKDLIGGSIIMSIDGTVSVGNRSYNVPPGDVVIADSENNLHVVKARTLNEKEIRTVLQLLSLNTGSQPTESYKLSLNEPIQFGNKMLKEIPVFYNETKKFHRATLINTLIDFGSKKGQKGEIYFVGQGSNTLNWTDFEGVIHSISTEVIQKWLSGEIKNNSDMDDLQDFLSKKRVNINEHLLNANSKFPEISILKDGVEVKSSRSYYDILLNDVLTTTTHNLPGYPNRVQRNLNLSYSAKSVEFTDINIPTEEPTKIEEPKKEKRFVKRSITDFQDKILSPKQSLSEKIKSGEIIQNCK